jgi:hypothetical protein
LLLRVLWYCFELSRNQWLKPQELESIDEIVVDTVYVEESCPRCGSANVFHLSHLGRPSPIRAA